MVRLFILILLLLLNCTEKVCLQLEKTIDSKQYKIMNIDTLVLHGEKYKCIRYK